MNTSETPNWYKEYKRLIEESITKYLDSYLALPMSWPLEEYKEIVKYAFRGWKKLRAVLALEFYLQLSGRDISSIRYDDDIIRLCIAIEAIHAYSLVHDDLPCMDNDDLRRWELTVWKKYWEHNAVLVWDLLNTLCFEYIADIKNPELSQKISKIISRSVWFYGMVGWQVEDLFYEDNIWELDIEILNWLHGKKTGKLIEASILSWVTLSWETSNMLVYWDFWKKLGLAFQVKDDLLDIEGTPEETWKSVWWEQKGFVYLLVWSEKIDFIVDYVWNRKK